MVPSRERFVPRGRLLAAPLGATAIPEASIRSGGMRITDQAYVLHPCVGACPARSLGPPARKQQSHQMRRGLDSH